MGEQKREPGEPKQAGFKEKLTLRGTKAFDQPILERTVSVPR